MSKLEALNSIGITGVNVFGLLPAGAGADPTGWTPNCSSGGSCRVAEPAVVPTFEGRFQRFKLLRSLKRPNRLSSANALW